MGTKKIENWKGGLSLERRKLRERGWNMKSKDLLECVFGTYFPLLSCQRCVLELELHVHEVGTPQIRHYIFIHARCSITISTTAISPQFQFPNSIKPTLWNFVSKWTSDNRYTHILWFQPSHVGCQREYHSQVHSIMTTPLSFILILTSHLCLLKTDKFRSNMRTLLKGPTSTVGHREPEMWQKKDINDKTSIVKWKL